MADLAQSKINYVVDVLNIIQHNNAFVSLLSIEWEAGENKIISTATDISILKMENHIQDQLTNIHFKQKYPNFVKDQVTSYLLFVFKANIQ
eukprot:868775_1